MFLVLIQSLTVKQFASLYYLPLSTDEIMSEHRSVLHYYENLNNVIIHNLTVSLIISCVGPISTQFKGTSVTNFNLIAYCFKSPIGATY